MHRLAQEAQSRRIASAPSAGSAPRCPTSAITGTGGSRPGSGTGQVAPTSVSPSRNRMSRSGSSARRRRRSAVRQAAMLDRRGRASSSVRASVSTAPHPSAPMMRAAAAEILNEPRHRHDTSLSGRGAARRVEARRIADQIGIGPDRRVGFHDAPRIARRSVGPADARRQVGVQRFLVDPDLGPAAPRVRRRVDGGACTVRHCVGAALQQARVPAAASRYRRPRHPRRSAGPSGKRAVDRPR